MIRFIDLRGQIYIDGDLPKEEQTPAFAFYDTVVCEFLTINHSQDWSSRDEVIGDLVIARAGPETVSRLVGLLPDWVPDTIDPVTDLLDPR